MLGSAALVEARSIVVLDNASIHHDLRVRKCIEAVGAILIYTTSNCYCPDLIPIEFCFWQYKAVLGRHYKRGNFFGAVHQEALESVTRHNMC